MKVSGAVAMADHVEAFGIDAIKSDYGRPIPFDMDPFTPSEPSVAEIARLRDVIQDAANGSAYADGTYCSCGMAWDAAKAVLKALRAP